MVNNDVHSSQHVANAELLVGILTCERLRCDYSEDNGPSDEERLRQPQGCGAPLPSAGGSQFPAVALVNVGVPVAHARLLWPVDQQQFSHIPNSVSESWHT